jgi:plastocyanin
MMRNMRAVAGALIVTVAAACGGGGGAAVTDPGGTTPGGGNPATCGTNTICMQFSAADTYSTTGSGTGSFAPATLTVATGATVTFANTSGVSHDVVFDAAAPQGGNIGVINSGTQARTFTAPGSYPFHCNIHAGMAGTVTVQ